MDPDLEMINPIFSNLDSSSSVEPNSPSPYESSSLTHEQTRLIKAFQIREPSFVGNYCKVDATIYPLAIFPNFLSPFHYKALRDELLFSIRFERKVSDLYDFAQSADLSSYTNQISTINKLRRLLLNQVRPLVQVMTGRPLDPNHLDLSAQLYQSGEYLLAHDDRLGGRRIAFVLYLVDSEWKDQDGGYLEFLSTDWKGDPISSTSVSPRLKQRFLPQTNTFVFFEVGLSSHHQVCQVTGSSPRLSISGWFHSSSPSINQFSMTPFNSSPWTFNDTIPSKFGKRGIIIQNAFPVMKWKSKYDSPRQIITPFESFQTDRFNDHPLKIPEWRKMLQSVFFRRYLTNLMVQHLDVHLDLVGCPVWKEYHPTKDYRMKKMGWKVLIIVKNQQHHLQSLLSDNTLIITEDDLAISRGSSAIIIEMSLMLMERE